MKHITTFMARNKKFEVVQDEKGFWAIEDKYITNGKLNRQINGIQGHLRETLEDCLETARISAEVDYLISNGVNAKEAIEMVIMG